MTQKLKQAPSTRQCPNLFLIHFARAYALAVYKSESLVEMRQAATVVQGLLDVEMRLHVEFCAGWGMSEAEMEELPEATGTMAYAQTGAGFLGAGSRKAFVHH